MFDLALFSWKNSYQESTYIIDKLVSGTYFYLKFMFSTGMVYISFAQPDLNPLYVFVSHYPMPIRTLVQFISCVGWNVLNFIVVLCLLSLLNGIVVTYLAANKLNASIGVNYIKKEFRIELGFERSFNDYFV